jgi:hypothetical protein
MVNLSNFILFFSQDTISPQQTMNVSSRKISSLFGWLVADDWCWFVLRGVLLAGCWWLVCCERKVLLAGG